MKKLRNENLDEAGNQQHAREEGQAAFLDRQQREAEKRGTSDGRTKQACPKLAVFQRGQKGDQAHGNERGLDQSHGIGVRHAGVADQERGKRKADGIEGRVLQCGQYGCRNARRQVCRVPGARFACRRSAHCESLSRRKRRCATGHADARHGSSRGCFQTQNPGSTDSRKPIRHWPRMQDFVLPAAIRSFRNAWAPG